MSGVEPMTALPPLAQLRSFVAVVAHGRLNRAAAALHLTESAVSHHLRRLEETLHARLLERGRAECTLTAAGERFYPHARDALGLLEEGVRELVGADEGKVVLTLPRAVATHWLVPRYASLQRDHGEIELQLLPTVRVCDLEREQIDLGLRLGSVPWPGLDARPLMVQRTCPVAAPALAGQWREYGWDAMVASERLVANTAHPAEWGEWCAAAGYELPASTRFTTLESFDLVLQAALAGAGLVMGRTPMVDDAVARGDLVAPFPQWIVTANRYFVVWPAHRPPSRYAHAVIDWLIACAAESDAAPIDHTAN